MKYTNRTTLLLRSAPAAPLFRARLSVGDERQREGRVGLGDGLQGGGVESEEVGVVRGAVEHHRQEHAVVLREVRARAGHEEYLGRVVVVLVPLRHRGRRVVAGPPRFFGQRRLQVELDDFVVPHAVALVAERPHVAVALPVLVGVDGRQVEPVGHPERQGTEGGYTPVLIVRVHMSSVAFLHELGEKDSSFTKEQMANGKSGMTFREQTMTQPMSRDGLAASATSIATYAPTRSRCAPSSSFKSKRLTLAPASRSAIAVA